MCSEIFLEARTKYHKDLIANILSTKNGVPSNADVNSKSSVAIASGILERMGGGEEREKLKGQTLGKLFEAVTQSFIEETFIGLDHLRPGDWKVYRGKEISEFEQFAHLSTLQALVSNQPLIGSILGNDYAITPDIILFREPLDDSEINKLQSLVDKTARLSSLRKSNGGKNLLHASVSCKWTLRSDRAQNARSEALNIVRNRKGQTPHIILVTAEPMPSRIASIALGTGDLDCVYHFALNELAETLVDLGKDDAKDMLDVMVSGKRLKDISDLPLDLAI